MTLSRKTAKDEALPKGWRRVKLGELCSDISYGYTATASSKPIGPKFLRITDIVSDRISWEDVPYCKIEDSKIDKYTLGIGDIVIARTGATTGYNQIIRSNVPSVFASYLIRCKLKQSIAYPFFISCVLQSAYWRNFIEGIKARSAQPGANAKDFSSFRIPLPTLPEQKAIASLLETWDTAIEKTEALIAEKEKQFKWLLKTLISDQQDNPEWRKVTLGNICTFEYGKPLKEQNRIGNQYPVFGSNGIIGGHNEYLVVGPFIVIGRKGSAGTVLYSTSSGFPIDTTFYINLQSKEVHLRFLYYLLLLVELDKISAQSGVPGLNRNDAYQISISMPSFVEQREITRILDVANCETDLLKQLAEQYRAQKRGLMQKLLIGKWRVQSENRK